jgi:hypothetical protein
MLNVLGIENIAGKAGCRSANIVAFYPIARIKMEVIGVVPKMEQEDSSAGEQQT